MAWLFPEQSCTWKNDLMVTQLPNSSDIQIGGSVQSLSHVRLFATP